MPITLAQECDVGGWLQGTMLSPGSATRQADRLKLAIGQIKAKSEAKDGEDYLPFSSFNSWRKASTLPRWISR